MALAFGQGLGLGAALIIAIGAQNAFVLRQGLKRQGVFLAALVCTLCDVLLIALGVAGLSSLISSRPLLTAIAAWGGALFLFVYGLRALVSALKPGQLEAETAPSPTSRRDVVLTTLAVSLLNPHVYLDTVVLLGSVGGQFAGVSRLSFGLGAATASSLWFFGLAYGAQRLGPLFRRPLAWRVLDVLIALVMWSIALSLVAERLR